MPTNNIANNWSRALRTLLQPKSIIAGAAAGLRLILNKVSGISSAVEPSDTPAGFGTGPTPVKIPAKSVRYVSGSLAGSGTDKITAGVGGISGYVVKDLPSGILIFGKSADMSDELLRGRDFIELSSGVYLFYKDPAANSVITVDGDVTLSWIVVVGTPSGVGYNAYARLFKNSSDYSVNRQYQELREMSDASAGSSTAGLYELSGCGRPISYDETIVKYWYEGAQGFGLTSEDRVIKLSDHQLGDTNAPGSSIATRATSNTYLYTLGGITRSLDISAQIHADNDINKAIPGASSLSKAELRSAIVERFGNTFDITKSSDSAETLKLLDTVTPKVLRQNIIQRLEIKASAVGLVDSTLRIYYGATESNAPYIEIPVNEKLNGEGAVRWISDNGRIIGRSPVIGDRVFRCEALSDSTVDGDCVILKCVQLPKIYLYPSGSLIITING